MNKNYCAVLLALCLLIISCQKELNFDPAAGSSSVCKSCSYIPFCDGSIYKYIDTAGGAATVSIDTLDLLSDTTIDGKVFQKFSNPGADAYYNCTNGVSTLIAYSVPATGGTVLKIEQTLLKANEPVGATWRNVITNQLGQTVDYDFTLVAKGISKTVLGVVYNDVMHVHGTISITVPILGTVIMGESDYFYANNIGLIDNITYTVNPFGPTTMALHRVLSSHFIP